MKQATLTQRQKIFVRNIASGMSQTKAAMEAGYSSRRASVTGSELIKMESVKYALEDTRKSIEEELDISPFWCAKRYIKLAETAENNGEIQIARGCLDSLSRLMGWIGNETSQKKEQNAFRFESFIEQIEQEQLGSGSVLR